jgi:predicted solute-binding protein
VNDDTLDMGKEGEKAIKELLGRAWKAKIIPKKIKPEIIRPK